MSGKQRDKRAQDTTSRDSGEGAGVAQWVEQSRSEGQATNAGPFTVIVSLILPFPILLRARLCVTVFRVNMK